MIKLSGLANCLWVSEPIHIATLFKEFEEKLPPEVKDLKTKGENNYDYATTMRLMGTSHTHKQYQEIVAYCAEDKFDIPGEPPSVSSVRSATRHSLFERCRVPAPDMCNLVSLQKLRSKDQSRENIRTLKYTKTLFINLENKANIKGDLQVKKDILISVRIHDTIFATETWRHYPCKPFTQEFLVLGSQTLSQLRDKIICSTDLRTSEEDTERIACGEDPEMFPKAKDTFKSAFFFIEDIFYNDFRDPANIDYSAVIKEWAEQKGIGPLSEGSLVETKFEDLTVRFGFPYAYVHQGNCEHIIVFSDASLLHDTDVSQENQYPLLKSIGVNRPKDCMICYYHFAKWVVFNNERLPVDPFYFCDGCLKSYNYVDGKKIGSFKIHQVFPLIFIQDD